MRSLSSSCHWHTSADHNLAAVDTLGLLVVPYNCPHCRNTYHAFVTWRGRSTCLRTVCVCTPAPRGGFTFCAGESNASRRELFRPKVLGGSQTAHHLFLFVPTITLRSCSSRMSKRAQAWNDAGKYGPYCWTMLKGPSWKVFMDVPECPRSLADAERRNQTASLSSFQWSMSQS